MKKLHHNQSGLMSFIVVIMIMVILTLIVLSFARIIRREQRQAVDRQLNTQAFYAAETAVNDTLDVLSNAPATSPLLATDYTTDCGQFIAAAGLDSDLGNGVSYSCLLVDTSPPQLRYSSVPPTQSIAMPIRPANAANPITSVEIAWEDTNPLDVNTNLAGCPTVGQLLSSWPGTCELGMLRIELVPFNGATSRWALTNIRSIAFVQPRLSGGSASYSFNESSSLDHDNFPGERQGIIRGANCVPISGTRRRCVITITGIENADSATWGATNGIVNGYMRIRSLYRTHAVTIRAFSAAGQVDLRGAQAEVDATGRVSDVLKRVKINAPLIRDEEQFPEFGLQTARSQCKRYELIPNTSTVNVSWYNPTAADNSCNPWQTVTEP